LKGYTMEFELLPRDERQGYLGTLRMHPDRTSTTIKPHFHGSNVLHAPTPSPASPSTTVIPASAPRSLRIPVPTLFVGKVFAPIPASQRALSQEALEAARLLGLAPMLAAAMAPADNPDRFWRAAVLSDPLTASNVVQACEVEGKKVLLVERGTAEALARGRIKLQALAQGDQSKGQGLGEAVTAPFKRLIDKLRWNKQVQGGVSNAWLVLVILTAHANS
jgi:hypothetical protein